MGIWSCLFRRHPECEHSWKALPWYLKTSECPAYAGCLTDFVYGHELIATYICTKCGKVKTKTLASGSTYSWRDHKDAVEQIKTQAADKLEHELTVKSIIQDEKLKVGAI